MALYYFHIRIERGLFEDEDGFDLPDLEAVRREALASAHEFLAEAEWSGPLAFEVLARARQSCSRPRAPDPALRTRPNQARACYDLIQSRAAARERTPMKLEAVFSERVAMALHSWRRAQSRST